MTPGLRTSLNLRRLLCGAARRICDALRGETAATFFDPYSPRDLARLLDEFDIPVLTADPRPADPEAARSAFDRVRQVYELRPDVREVFPLGLTPAQRGEYAAWLFRHGRTEYGLRDDDILCYLFTLADDPTCGLGDTYLLSSEWQRTVPQGLTAAGWDDLKRWLRQRHPDRVGRWLRSAKRPAKSDELLAADPSRTINLLGHFKYDSGLQEEALQHATALEQAGYRVCLRDVPIAYPREWRDGGRFTNPELGGVTLIKTGANEPLDGIYQRAGLHPRPGVYRVACWSWELEEWPRNTAERSGLADEVWTPSEFCAAAARAAMPGKPVHAMQPAVTLPDFAPRPRGDFGLPTDRFLFLFVFDMASGMERKNPLGLIRAFRRAFRPDEPVHLAIKVSRGQNHPEEFAELRRAAGLIVPGCSAASQPPSSPPPTVGEVADRRSAGGGAEKAFEWGQPPPTRPAPRADLPHEGGGEDPLRSQVTLIDRVMPRVDVGALLATCDSYVSLHRSEGFGFTMAEAMLLGKPTVATGYSGNLDFMTAENSFLVRFERVALDRDYPPYPTGGAWAQPSEEHAAELMRHVFEDRADAAAVAARGRETVARFLSREAAAQRMTARLAEIARR
jgi:glycosyltransferase involved in cell wall biosynthesis